MNKNSVNLLPSIIIAWAFFLNYGTHIFYVFSQINVTDAYKKLQKRKTAIRLKQSTIVSQNAIKGRLGAFPCKI